MYIIAKVNKVNNSVNQKGSSYALPAHGWVGARATVLVLHYRLLFLPVKGIKKMLYGSIRDSSFRPPSVMRYTPVLPVPTCSTMSRFLKLFIVLRTT